MHEMIAKVIRCGDIYEVQVFEKPVAVGFSVSRKHPDLRPEREVGERRMDNIARARKNVRQLTLTNQTEYTKFLTLTYANSVLDYDSAVHDFKMFIKNLKRLGYDNLPYLYILEHQTERGEKEGNIGSLHFHVLIFTDTFLPFVTLKRAWGKRGSVYIEAIEDVRNLGAYVCKYITKDGYVGDNKPMYHISRGLNRPEEKCVYLDGGHDQGFGLNDNSPKETIQNFLDSLDIYYQNETHFTYDIKGEDVEQRVKYFQGRRKRCKN